MTVHLEDQEREVSQENKVIQEHLADQVQQDEKDLQVDPDQKDHVEIQVCQERQVHPVKLDDQDYQELKETVELQEIK